jgi:alkylation response protein AidB-like acyl-CoA dehydrogenase
MRFELSEDQALLRASTRDFFLNEWPIEKVRKVLEQEPRGYDAEGWSRLAEMGYLGLTLPASVGGQGLGAIELSVVLEEMGRACVPGPFLDVALAADLLAAVAGQEALLTEIAAGSKMVAIARTDSPYAGTAGKAVRLARGKLRGSKYFVPFAASADALLVTTAKAVYLVAGPFEVTPLPTFDLAQRFGLAKLNHAGAELGPLTLLERTDQLAAIGAAAMLLGTMSRALDMTLDYVRTRQTFGRPIGSFQALQHRLADMLLKTESTRSAVYRAAWCFDNADPETALAAAAAKAYAGDAARVVCGEAIQMHGGIGFTWELDLHFFFKRAKTLEQHYGSTEAVLERTLQAAGL